MQNGKSNNTIITRPFTAHLTIPTQVPAQLYGVSTIIILILDRNQLTDHEGKPVAQGLTPNMTPELTESIWKDFSSPLKIKKL